MIYFLEIIHLPITYLEQRFGDWTLSPSAGKMHIQLGAIDIDSANLRTGPEDGDAVQSPKRCFK
jgi:hypothetical protein